AAAGDAADEQNAAANEAAGSTAEAHPVPHSPPFSFVRESSPKRQPETEWVVPNPVSPGTDWRPWPSVPPPRTPTPPAQTLSFEEPLVFGPVPKPAGYVDPDTIDPIIFGPPPRPYDFVDPALEEPVIFGPLPRPANYIEPEDIDNLNSMEDDTILGGFHEETHGLTRMATEALGHYQVLFPLDDMGCNSRRRRFLLSNDVVNRRAGRVLYSGFCAFSCFLVPTDFLLKRISIEVRWPAKPRRRTVKRAVVQQLAAEDLAQGNRALVSDHCEGIRLTLAA
ncbi:hypothetical protein Tco_1026542, partial [Tanacetum coccineum]